MTNKNSPDAKQGTLFCAARERRTLCDYKHVEIIEAHAMPDHIHMLVSIPPKLAVADFMGYLKANGKYKYGRRVFWAKGYYVNTVGGKR